LTTAIELASVQPAELLAVTNHRLDVGCPANLVLFDLPGPDTEKLIIRGTMNAGRWCST
jgi:dihydroorotase-like cyclic amidohydrolase